MNNFSIIWSENDTRNSFSDFTFVQDLDLNNLINLGTKSTVGALEQKLETFFTKDRETIINRCEMFFEFLNDPALYSGLVKSFSELADICKLKQEKSEGHSNELMIYSIKELEMYVDYVETMRELFASHPVKGVFLGRLRDEILNICSSENYPKLCEEVKKQVHTINHVKSVSVGINLNAQMQPVEAGVVKVNSDSYFESGNFIDKLLKLDFKEDEFTCSAPLIPVTKGITDQEAQVMRITLNSALNKIFASTLRSWEKTVRKYVVGGLDDLFLILSEWQFVTACTDALFKLRAAGQSFCKPIFADADSVKDLYHPMLAISSKETYVVKNDLEFDSDRIYILTGPNQGGKSIFTKSVGVLYAMLHLGLPLPASHAEICPVDGIFTHFIDNNNERAYKNGRLAGECEAIQKINRKITDKSIFLFDEALSSTSADEAIVLAREILLAYSSIGIKGIYTTHLHGLCELESSEQKGRSKICNLSAELNESSHSRTYRIKKGGRYGQSYAMDIAKNYHLTREDILSMQKAERTEN